MFLICPGIPRGRGVGFLSAFESLTSTSATNASHLSPKSRFVIPAPLFDNLGNPFCMKTSGKMNKDTPTVMSSEEMANASNPSLVPLISDQQREIIDCVNHVFLSSAIGLFGIVANVMNMVVFFQQGFASTMNISFFGLAISDLCGLLIMLWCNVCFNPLLAKSDVPVIGQELMYLTAGIPRVYFGRTTAWITVYITAERCLSIMVPLKVKLIITPRRTTCILKAIYVIMVSAFLPEYATCYVDWKFYPLRNMTMLGLLFKENREDAEGLTYIMYSFMGSASFIAVVVFTVTLIVQLKQKSKWRMKAKADKSTSESINNRERKTVTMVVMIATVLIVCYIPGVAVSLVTFFEPEFSVAGIEINAYFVFWSIDYLSEAINSSINIFLYYRMSSKYRETFDEIFSVCRAGSKTCKRM